MARNQLPERAKPPLPGRYLARSAWATPSPPTASYLLKWKEKFPRLRRESDRRHLNQLDLEPYKFETELFSACRPTDRVDPNLCRSLRSSKRTADSNIGPCPISRDQFFDAGQTRKPTVCPE